MNNQYPKMLYKTPGPHEIHGGRFDTLIVQDEDDLASALADGWAKTTPDALAIAAGGVKAKIVAAEQEPGPAPITVVAVEPATVRADLELKATEIGLKVDGRWSDKRLGDEIAAKIAEG